ncbi:hypothetical protein ALIPUT_00191 [Alistipes putredinis DSM 17216]|uniref:Uncharacterized protein n=1 Tax=Alistipes putredinis DSM 17216 TaxID=445970 RepID=B0MU82_9BACT|nr:hypothetical protein ALIPUT_00191 [Alistipes putredinis DSM 17216]
MYKALTEVFQNYGKIFFKGRKNGLTKPMRKRMSAYCELWTKK